MISQSDIYSSISNPQYVENLLAHDLRELIDLYPYCETLHHIYLRKLMMDNDVRYEAQLSDSCMHISDRKVLYNYLYHSAETDVSIMDITLQSGDYFATQNNPVQKKTLQELAMKLKEARLQRNKEIAEAKAQETGSNVEDATQKGVVKAVLQVPKTNDDAIKCIKEKKYSEAVEILRELNLNNPKKSVYFADQIKFLETILENEKDNNK